MVYFDNNLTNNLIIHRRNCQSNLTLILSLTNAALNERSTFSRFLVSPLMKHVATPRPTATVRSSPSAVVSGLQTTPPASIASLGIPAQFPPQRTLHTLN